MAPTRVARSAGPAELPARASGALRAGGGLLPLAAGLRLRERRLLGASWAVLLVLIVLDGAHALAGLGGASFGEFVLDWVTSGIYGAVAVIVAWRALRCAGERTQWTIFAAGLGLYALGNITWAAWFEHLANPPVPSICDAMWLSFYPAAYLGIIGLARVERQPFPARIWLDALIAGLGTAAIGVAVFLPPVVSSLSGRTAADITELAYPVCDLLLAGLVVSVLALRGWRRDRMWTLLGAGFIVLAVADCLYAVQVASGSLITGEVTNLIYEVGVALLALGAWQPAAPSGEKAAGRAVLAVPAAFTFGALGLLVYDHFSRLDAPALALALMTIVAAFARTGVAFSDVQGLAETRRQAFTDDLTLMPNRRHFLRRLGQGIEAAGAANTGLALMLVDLDHFKELNDTLGHDAGDRLLGQVGERLRRVVRETDIAARLGGDEFGLLLSCSVGRLGADTVAHHVKEALAEPFVIDGISLRVTASIGISLYPEDSQDGQRLMQFADVAMYEAKKQRSGHAFYTGEQDNHSRERLTLAGEIAEALKDGAIEAHFQPKATAAEGRITGIEALGRWRHPTRGLIAPSDFVPIAEQAGLGPALTARMLELALGQLRRWRDEGLDLHVAVNTTVADLQNALFPEVVAETLRRFELPPDALVLEVTENMVVADPVRVGDVLARLGELGIGLSLDDFGTGFSSLSHVKTLPVGEVKIDRSFVAEMASDAVDAAIVLSTIHLARTIGVRVVAEGVEDRQTWRALQDAGCELIQGYAVSRPLPGPELGPLLHSAPSIYPALRGGPELAAFDR
jgi:diguanylate cyclase (GGDEF)-like protein